VPLADARAMNTTLAPVASILAAVLLAATGCGASGGSPSDSGGPSPSQVDGVTVPTPRPDPADFTEVVDNPWLPLRPGSEWVYSSIGDEGPEKDVVTVTDHKRVVAGVRTVVVHDVVRNAKGEVVEDTWDWYAQDRHGNVWYFGEDTTAFEHGKKTTEGSWEAGKHGAQAGIAMLAEPDVGDTYQQEYREGVAEDRGRILSLSAQHAGPAGSWTGLVRTEDTTPLEPGLVENKYYAKGVGVVHEETLAGGREDVELVSHRR
jgi:hypothetical protein